MREELILEVIKDRRSLYSFSSMKVEEFKLKALFEAAGYAPSVNSENSWLFLFTTRENDERFGMFLNFLSDSEKVWAKNAYAIIIPMVSINKSDAKQSSRLAYFDAGMAVGNLLVQATALDLIVHQTKAFSGNSLREYLKLSDDIEPVTMMFVGYMGDGDLLPPDLVMADENKAEHKPVYEYSFKDYLYNSAFK